MKREKKKLKFRFVTEFKGEKVDITDGLDKLFDLILKEIENETLSI